MDLVVAGIELAALVAPTIGALIVIARHRAMTNRLHRVELSALRAAFVSDVLAPVALSTSAANEPACDADTEISGFASSTHMRLRAAVPRPMAEIVEAILAERYTEAGTAPPLTTAAQRGALASCLPAGTFDARANAHELRLVPRRADLPEATPFQLVHEVLLYRPGAHEEAWILAGVAAKLLTRSGIAWNEADLWTLARALAGNFSLLDVENDPEVTSGNVSA